MRPAQTLKGCSRWLKQYGRRRRESNPCTGLCRPLPKPLGHSAAGASFAGGRHAASQGCGASPGGATAIPDRDGPSAVGRVNPKPRFRADDGIRTRDPHLGKVMLYQLSHVRVPARVHLGPDRRISPALRSELYPILAQPPTRSGDDGVKICLPNVRGSLCHHPYHRSGAVYGEPGLRSG
jgi:hypothetical protein